MLFARSDNISSTFFNHESLPGMLKNLCELICFLFRTDFFRVCALRYFKIRDCIFSLVKRQIDER